MRAMVFEQIGSPLRLVEMPVPKPTRDEVLIEVNACGVCLTDLHVIDGDLVSRLGPRLYEGVENIARCLHPDVFTE